MTPVDDAAEAKVGSLLVQAPPEGELERVIVNPGHTDVGPVMLEGSGFTVCTLVIKQPVLLKI